MICVSVAEKTVAGCLAALEGISFAEVRMDAMDLPESDVPTIFSGRNLIATCRPGAFADDRRKALLLGAIASGAAFVDVELEAPAAYREEIAACARSTGCKVIVSFHDYLRTPSREELCSAVSACFDARADIAKIACMVHAAADNARLLGLLDGSKQLVVVGMGELGRITRIVAPFLGSPFTFASAGQGRETASGQIDHGTLRKVLELLAREGLGRSEP